MLALVLTCGWATSTACSVPFGRMPALTRSISVSRTSTAWTWPQTVEFREWPHRSTALTRDAYITPMPLQRASDIRSENDLVTSTAVLLRAVLRRALHPRELLLPPSPGSPEKEPNDDAFKNPCPTPGELRQQFSYVTLASRGGSQSLSPTRTGT